ncbi:MAG: epimerase [Dyella sp.]
MKILLFGASGMLGQGVLRECLRDPAVSEVVSVVRRPGAVSHPKLREIVKPEMRDFADQLEAWRTIDACFFCLGISAAGMDEAAYRAVTYDLTLAVAKVLAQAHPGAAFVYVSGDGTDSSERGRVMWARVKGATENALFKLPLKAVAFRPGLIRASHGEISKTPLYRRIYAVIAPLLPLLQRVAPNALTSTEQIARAMLAVARGATDHIILSTRQINRL